MTFTGGCLCGAIRYEVTGEPVRAQICHCDDCRRSTGASCATNVFVHTSDLKVTKGEPRIFKHKADSGNVRVKAFCGTCGSQLFGWGENKPEMTGIKVGTIDDASFVRPWAHVYVSRALPFTVLEDGLKKFERGAS